MKNLQILGYLCTVAVVSACTSKPQEACSWLPPLAEKDAECAVAPATSWYMDASGQCTKLPSPPYVCSEGPFATEAACISACYSR